MTAFMELVALAFALVLPKFCNKLQRQADRAMKENYQKLKEENISKLSGEEAASKVVPNVTIDDTDDMTDCYIPRLKTLCFSAKTREDKTIASLAVAAHECGHAVQDNFLIVHRGSYGLAQYLSTEMSFYITVIGLLLYNVTPVVLWVGTICSAVSALLHLIEVPIERDASARGLRLFTENDVMTIGEAARSKTFLQSAGNTYLINAFCYVLEFAWRICIIAAM